MYDARALDDERSRRVANGALTKARNWAPAAHRDGAGSGVLEGQLTAAQADAAGAERQVIADAHDATVRRVTAHHGGQATAAAHDDGGDVVLAALEDQGRPRGRLDASVRARRQRGGLTGGKIDVGDARRDRDRRRQGQRLGRERRRIDLCGRRDADHRSGDVRRRGDAGGAADDDGGVAADVAVGDVGVAGHLDRVGAEQNVTRQRSGLGMRGAGDRQREQRRAGRARPQSGHGQVPGPAAIAL